MKILLVTHSDRQFFEPRASLNALESRFPIDRLNNLPSFKALKPVTNEIAFRGNLTLWLVDEESKRIDFLYLYKTDDKIQFSTFHKDRLLVLCSTKLEVLDLEFNVVKTIRDPQLIGGHTVHVDQDGRVLITSAPGNCVLRLDLELGKIVERIEMPAMYGRGYDYESKFSLYEHFIPTDYQPTHVNSAVPVKDGFLVSLWIPGAIGVFKKMGSAGDIEKWEYREIVSGYRGCHGARYIEKSNEVCFADSAAGLITFIDFSDGTLKKRIRVGSNWLHDAISINDQLLIAGLSDMNELRVIDRASGESLQSVDCSKFGECVMFVNCQEADKEWINVFDKLEQCIEPTEPLLLPKLGDDLLPAIDPMYVIEQEEIVLRKCLILKTPNKLQFEYILKSPTIRLTKGDYLLSANVRVYKCSVALSILNIKADKWITSQSFDFGGDVKNNKFHLENTVACQIIFSASNIEEARLIDAEILSVTLRKVIPIGNAETDGGYEISLSENILGPSEQPIIGSKEGNYLIAMDDLYLSNMYRSTKKLKFEYLLFSEEINLLPGKYRIQAMVAVTSGELTIGVQNVSKDEWIHQMPFNKFLHQPGFHEFDMPEAGTVKMVAAAANPDKPANLVFELIEVSLRPIHKQWVLIE